jgi:UDP-N-acetylglucosamine 2-epimerase (non-hydrolysing)
MKKIMIIFGTRPEAIKMAPVIKVLKKENYFETIVCSTGQHREMLKQVLDIFDIKIDYDLDLMRQNQDLFDISVYSLTRLKEVLTEHKPDVLMVQGDTSTAFISALAAFYKQIKIAHVEAGLRSYNIKSPYPEEANRRFISVISDFNFAPTEESKQNLINEGFSENSIFITGNTVIDALYMIKGKLEDKLLCKKNEEEINASVNEDLFIKPFILITMHRREKFGEEFKSVLNTIKDIALQRPNYNFIYPVHLNPNVQTPVNEILKGVDNIKLIPPQDYFKFIYLMSKCLFIMTDSGGVQEECFVFEKPVMVLRDVTERNEAIKAGYAFLVSSDDKLIKDKFFEIETKLNEGYNYFNCENPFGNGKSAEIIKDILVKNLI